MESSDQPTTASPTSPPSPPTSAPSPLPYGYYDDIRASDTATFVPLVEPQISGFPGGRNLYRAIDPEEGLPSPGVILCHIPSFLRWTQLDQSTSELIDVSDGGYDGAVGVLLAMHHFNNGIGTIVDELEGINEKCTIRFTTESIDTLGWELAATIELLSNIVDTDFDDATNPQMCAVIGATTSGISRTLAAQTGVFQLPQFSPTASSAMLNNYYEYPLFGRTIPSDAATAARMTEFLQKYVNVNYFGMLYVNDAYGNSFHQEVRNYAALLQMTLFGVPITVDAAGFEIEEALQFLKEKGVNYIVGIFYPANYEQIMGRAYEMEMAGEGKLWIFTSAIDPIFAQPEPDVRLQTDSPAAKASQGNAIFLDEGGLPGFPQYDRFLKEWAQLASDEEALQYINSKVPEWNIHAYFANDNETFAFNRTRDYFLADPTFSASFAYDAVVAMGLGACLAQGNIDLSANATYSPTDANATFSGASHFAYTLETKFVGATGQVSFGADGYPNRDGNTTSFVISNVQEEIQSDGTSTFSSVPTLYYDVETDSWTQYRNRTFLFPGYAETPPLDIPPPDTTLLHFSPAARGICLALSCLAMIASIFFLAYTIAKRKHRIIRASQPEFLIEICVGCLLMASTIIPLSFDTSIASEQGCAIACSARFWLVSCGFCLAFVSLFAKLWRINRVMKNARGFKKVKVTPADVIVPGVVLLGCNLIVLTTWMIVSPFSWKIDTLVTDEFGRPLVQVGTCHSDWNNLFIALLLTIDGIAIVITLWQAYIARNIRTDLSESKYIALATTAIFEATFIGVPVMFIVNENPNAVLFLGSAIIFISVMALLFFIFGPKVVAIHKGRDLSPSTPAGGFRPGANAIRNDSGEIDRLKNEVDRLKREVEELRMGASKTADTIATTMR